MDAVFNETVNIVEIDEGFDHYTLVTFACVITTVCVLMAVQVLHVRVHDYGTITTDVCHSLCLHHRAQGENYTHLLCNSKTDRMILSNVAHI